MAKQKPNPEEQNNPPEDPRDKLLEGMEEQPEGDDSSAEEPTENTTGDEGDHESQPPQSGDGGDSGARDPEPTEPRDGEGSEGQWNLVEQLRSLGWQGDDEQEAAQALLRSYQEMSSEQQRLQERLAEQEELARYGTTYLREQREREEQQAAAQQQQQDAKADPWWNPPKYDPQWLEQYRDVTLGQDGQPEVGWKPNTPAEVKQAVEQHEAYLNRWATDLVQRPHEVLPKVIEQEFDRLFEERISQRDAEARATEFASRVEEAHSDWMYTTDSSGQRRLTPDGERMLELVQEMGQKGIQDPEDRWLHAVALFDYERRQYEANQQRDSTEAQRVAEQKRKQVQKKGTSAKSNRTGSVPKPEDEGSTGPQNSNLSPGQQLLQQLRLDGADV